MNLFLFAGGSEGGENPFALITPDPGLFIWTLVVFVILWALLAKFAFKPIAKALKNREDSISDALQSAERARAEVAELKNENEEILKQARQERSLILKEANEMKDRIVAEAKDGAKTEATKLLADAKREIETQKTTAMAEVKSEVGNIAVEIAEKLMKKNLSESGSQQELIKALVKEANMN